MRVEKLMLVLRDGRKLIGVLRSWDQFGKGEGCPGRDRRAADHALRTANLVFQDTVERIFIQDIYADIPRGIFIVRGENVLLLGEIVRSFNRCFRRRYARRSAPSLIQQCST